MAKRAPAQLEADWGGGRIRTYKVQYNPKELSFEKGVQLAEINIPGLDAPLQQFVRGQAEKLSLELFFDTTEDGMGEAATSVTARTDEIYKLVKVDPDSHAPPVVTFRWGVSFPGDSVSFQAGASPGADAEGVGEQGGSPGGQGKGNQQRSSFRGIAESVRQQFTLFSSEGVPLRATLNLVLREYRPLDDQLLELGLNSPDRTHAHALSSGETLSGLAHRYYLDASRWRWLADDNRISDPRRLIPGTILSVPSIDDKARR